MLDEESGKELCLLCFSAVEADLDEKPPPVPPAKFNSMSYPLFVTWYDKSKVDEESPKGALRGCIGTFSPRSSLGHTAMKFAILSALEDERFLPVSHDELPELVCNITLLIDFREMKDINDFVIGEDGVSLSYDNPYGYVSSSTYLPSVILEAGWNHKDTLRNLLVKAGVGRTDVDDEMLSKIKLEKYRGLVYSATYDEYAKYKRSGK